MDLPVRCPARAASPRERLLWGFALAGAAGLAAVVARFDPTRFPFFPRCLLHEVTGLHCPGCGATRATHQLLHGQVGAAAAYNPLLVLALPLVVWAGLSVLLLAVRGRGLPVVQVPFAWIRAAVAIVVLYGVLRNLPFPPFDWLAPGP